MTAVKPNHTTIANERSSSAAGQVHAELANDLVTRFFYREERLCFQILRSTKSGEKIVFQEFTEYVEYKRVLSELQQMKAKEDMKTLPEKKIAPKLAA